MSVKKIVKKIGDIIWFLFKAIAIIFALLIYAPQCLWPKKQRVKTESDIGWFFFPHLFERKMSKKTYFLIVIILLILIAGWIVVLKYIF